MPQVIEACRSCGSRDLEWQVDRGWVTGSWRWLRCKDCGDTARLIVPAWTWALYAIAAAAAIWGWVVVS